VGGGGCGRGLRGLEGEGGGGRPLGCGRPRAGDVTVVLGVCARVGVGPVCGVHRGSWGWIDGVGVGGGTGRGGVTGLSRGAPGGPGVSGRRWVSGGMGGGRGGGAGGWGRVAGGGGVEWGGFGGSVGGRMGAEPGSRPGAGGICRWIWSGGSRG